MTIEHDWYGKDWKILRSQLVKLCLRHSELLLRETLEIENILLKEFITIIGKDINDRIPLDQLGLWQHCLPLLIRTQWLEKELERDRKALSGQKTSKGRKVSPRQALARKLNLFFEMNRRQHIADELGVSSNKVKTWERLDKISRKISQEQSINRCSDGHFEELAVYVKSYHGHDKNLPRRANTVKGYFYLFSDECIENIESRDNTMDKLSLQDAKDLLQGVGMVELGKCLQELSLADLEIIDVSFNLGMSNVNYLSIDTYIQDKQLDKNHFTNQQDKAMAQLRQCLELGLAARQGGHA